MYKHHVPYGEYPTYIDRAVLIEGGERPDEVMQFCRLIGATFDHPGEGKLFFVAFADSPWMIESYTEDALRASIPTDKIEPKHVDERPNGF